MYRPVPWRSGRPAALVAARGEVQRGEIDRFLVSTTFATSVQLSEGREMATAMRQSSVQALSTASDICGVPSPPY